MRCRRRNAAIGRGASRKSGRRSRGEKGNHRWTRMDSDEKIGESSPKMSAAIPGGVYAENSRGRYCEEKSENCRISHFGWKTHGRNRLSLRPTRRLERNARLQV